MATRVNDKLITDKSKNELTSTEYIKHGSTWLADTINTAVSTLSGKADKTYVDTEIAKKANTSAVTVLETKVNSKADASTVSQLQTAVNSKADSSTVAALSSQVSSNTTGIAEANSRIDQIIALPEGSTTGDARLEDICVMIDGQTAPSPGDAVRKQVTDLKSDLNQLFEVKDYICIERKQLFDESKAIMEGMYEYNGGGRLTPTSTGHSTNFIPIAKGRKVTINKNYMHLVFWNTDKTFNKGVIIGTDNHTFEMPVNGYITISGSNSSMVGLMINYGTESLPYEPYNKIDASIENASASSSSIDALEYASVNRINLFDESNAILEGMYEVAGKGNLTPSTTGHSTNFIPVIKGRKVTMNKNYMHLVFWNKDKTFNSGIVVSSGAPYTFEMPISGFITVSGSNSSMANLMINYGETAIPYEPYNRYEQALERLDNIDMSKDKYNLPYVYNGKCCCNKNGDDVTAYYAGVVCESTPTSFEAKVIFEEGTETGSLALIFNPNGANRVSHITDNSLHCVILNNRIQLDVLGQKFGEYYYHAIIHEEITNPIPLDGQTEAYIKMNVSGNTVTVTITHSGKTETHSGTWNGDGTHTLSDFLGRYAIFEHFCNGNRNAKAMPQFTMIKIKGTNDCIFDYFERENGVLSTTPNGSVYHLFTVEEKYRVP